MTRREQIAKLDEAIALQPERAWYHELKGVYQVDTREFENAQVDLSRAITLAGCLRKTGRLGEAEVQEADAKGAARPGCAACVDPFRY